MSRLVRKYLGIRFADLLAVLGAAVLVLEPVTSLLAQNFTGPCRRDRGPFGTNNVTCTGGTCVGQSVVYLPLSHCLDQPDNPACAQNPNSPAAITTPPTPLYMGNATWWSCLLSFSNFLCATCIVAAVGLGAATALIGGAIGGVACYFVCSGVGAGLNPCCWTACTFNVANSYTSATGTTCPGG